MKSIYESNLFKTLLAISLRSKPETLGEVIIIGLIQIQIFVTAIFLVVGLGIAKYFGTINELLRLFSDHLIFIVLICLLIVGFGYFYIRRSFSKNYIKIENINYPNEEYEAEVRSTSSFFDSLMVFIVILMMILLLL